MADRLPVGAGQGSGRRNPNATTIVRRDGETGLAQVLE